MLYQNRIDPYFSSPLSRLEPYQAHKYAGGATGLTGQQPSSPAPGRNASNGMNPMQSLNMAMRLKNQLMGGNLSSAGTGGTGGLGGTTGTAGTAGSAAPLQSASAAPEAASALAEGGAAGSEGLGSGVAGMGAGSAWMLPVIAAAVMSGVALNEGESPRDVFGSKGWGGYPMECAEAVGDGDWRRAGGRVLRGGGVGPSALIGAAVEGGSGKDYLSAALGAPVSFWDWLTKGGSTMDLIGVFGHPNG